jgi:uncharacterized repeat protein (TIGR01451 family)
MLHRVGKQRPRPHNLPHYRALSFILSTALVLLPVLPAGVARAAAPARRAEPAGAPQAAPFAPPLAPLAPSLSATKVDAFADPDNDGKAEPGQTITYTVTVTNNGPDDATNVVFTDTVDPNTTLVPGSVQTQPIAANDTYNVLGNVRIQPNAAAGLLANDTDPDTGNSSGLTASGPSTSAQGGNVTVNNDGSFSYNPPAGYEGPDSFSYTVTDGSSSDTATVNLTVNDVVWFVKNDAPAGGDGRLTSPYNSLASVNGGGDLDEPGEVIFVYEGTGAYPGGIALEDGQRLVGQGISLDAVLASVGIGVPPHSDARPAATSNPTINNAAGNVVTLANGNGVYAVNAAASAAGSSGVSGSGVGGTTLLSGVNASASGSANALSLTNFAGSFLMTGGSAAGNSSGTSVLISGGSTGINFAGVAITQNGGRVVDIQNRTGGTVSFDSATGVTGTNGTTDAVSVLSNAGTVTFAGPIQLNTNATGARGLVADSAGFTLNLTNGGNAISSTGGAAVDLENLTVNVSLATTFSTNSNGRGIRVDTVSGTASFGNATVNNSANTGVLLTDNPGSVTFTDLDIAPAPNVRALHAVNNTGTLSSSSGVVVTSGAVAVEITGASSAARSPLNVQLTSVSASGDSNGIVLTNTNGPGASVGFVVNGDGTNTTAGGNGTGGTIANTAGADGATAGIAVLLNNADEVTLRRMQINDHPNFAIRGTNVSNFNLEYSTVNGTNGTSDLVDEGSVVFDELTGSAGFVGSVVQGGVEDNIRVVNTAGTLDRITFSNTTVGPMSTTTGNDAVLLQARNSAVLKATVEDSTFTSARGDILQFDLTHTATGELIFQDNVVNNQHPAIVTGGGGVTLSGGGSPAAAPTLNYDIQGNSFRGARGTALLVIFQTGSGSATGRVEGNTFGVSGVSGSCSLESNCVEFRTEGRAAQTVLVDNNTIQQYGGQGVYFEFDGINTAGSTGTIGSMNATVINNTVQQPVGSPTVTSAGVHFNFGATAGDTYQGCADVQNNAGAAGGETDAGAGVDYLLRQRNLTTLRLPGYAGANNSNAAVVTFIQGQNIGAESVTAQNSVAGGGGGFVGGAPCAVPANLVSSIQNGDNNAVETAAAAPAASAGGFAGALPSLGKLREGFANAEGGRALTFGSVTGFAQPEPLKAAAAPVALAGETINVNIGTLKAGDSVTITFQVTVADPFTGSQPQVSNQGTVTADGGISVLTDDPSVAGAFDPTVTPILLPPTINVHDATVAEPASGSANMSFTVSLSSAYTQPVEVEFATANGGANPATAGTDYTTTTGQITFAAGETVKTINVPVLADINPAEGDEHFLVNLSNPDNGTIGDGQATGTITDESVASPVIISELRTSGPGGSGDDFVELLNTTDNPITVPAGGYGLFKMGAGCGDTPVLVGTVPAGAVIPARGNYLLTGSGYSLGGYAAGDAALSADIEDDRNVGLFTTTNLADISSVNRLDAVGSGLNVGENCELLREGSNLSAASGSTSQYSFVRKVTLGMTHDTGNNAADFVVVSTTPAAAVGDNATPTLGAPGPEGGASPTGPVPCAVPSGTPLFGRERIDTTVSGGSAPNTVRDNTPVTNGALGTLEFRRTFTNNTGAPVTRLRFRAVDLSTTPAGGDADLRALSSVTAVVATAGGPVTVNGTTVETPPAQPSGGGVNSSLAAGSITLATPLPAGSSVSLSFLFGVQQAGDYDIAFVLEALPGPTGQDIWKLSGHTETGVHTDGGCNEPPVANAGIDQTLECEDGQAAVTLDGSGSSDPDGDTPLTYEWKEGATVLGATQTLMVNLPTGSHTITLTVTDPSGASGQDTVVILVEDTEAPEVTAPADVTVSTGPGATSCGVTISAETLGTATADDDCEGTLTASGTRSDNQPLNAPYPVGTTVITWTATDGAGHTGYDTQNVKVIDNTPPTVTAPADKTVPADPNSCSANVDPGTATADDNCAVDTIAGTRSDNQPLNAPYPVGTTTITWTATDVNGNQATDTQTVTVQDTQAPTLSSSVAVTTMGPPFNHALINVGLSATASDNCGPVGPFQVFVYSDEDDGPAPHSPDATNIGIGSLRLRRERDGGSNGRVYLIVVKVTDASGNTSVSVTTVTVPLSNSAADQASVNAQASAAAAHAAANNGAAPAGYFVVGP